LGAIAVAAFLFWQRMTPSASQTAPMPAPEAAAPPPPPPANFRDCAECPEMMRLAGGSFLMGAPAGEPGRNPWEGPQHEVHIAAFAIGVREVTLAEWDACVTAGGCNGYTPSDRGWGRDARPVLSVSWQDAQAYVRWLSEHTGRAYRLPSEAEWEFAARGGATSAYWWGDAFDPARVSIGRTSETGALGANAFGLFDVTGNVAEWVEDCYVNNYASAPGDGSPVLAGDCSRRVVRGGSWRDNGDAFRISARSRVSRAVRDSAIGFRVAAAP
jgi:formylglycine-generating enzyme required for sulfatase activity